MFGGNGHFSLVGGYWGAVNFSINGSTLTGVASYGDGAAGVTGTVTFTEGGNAAGPFSGTFSYSGSTYQGAPYYSIISGSGSFSGTLTAGGYYGSGTFTTTVIADGSCPPPPTPTPGPCTLDSGTITGTLSSSDVNDYGILFHSSSSTTKQPSNINFGISNLGLPITATGGSDWVVDGHDIGVITTNVSLSQGSLSAAGPFSGSFSWYSYENSGMSGNGTFSGTIASGGNNDLTATGSFTTSITTKGVCAPPPPPPPPTECVCGWWVEEPQGTPGDYYLYLYENYDDCNYWGSWPWSNQSFGHFLKRAGGSLPIAQCPMPPASSSSSSGGVNPWAIIPLPSVQPSFYLPAPVPAPIWGYIPQPRPGGGSGNGSSSSSSSSGGGLPCPSIYNTLIMQCLLGESGYGTSYCTTITSQWCICSSSSSSCATSSSSGSSSSSSSSSSASSSSSSGGGLSPSPAASYCPQGTPSPPPPPSARYVCGVVYGTIPPPGSTAPIPGIDYPSWYYCPRPIRSCYYAEWCFGTYVGEGRRDFTWPPPEDCFDKCTPGALEAWWSEHCIPSEQVCGAGSPYPPICPSPFIYRYCAWADKGGLCRVYAWSCATGYPEWCEYDQQYHIYYPGFQNWANICKPYYCDNCGGSGSGGGSGPPSPGNGPPSPSVSPSVSPSPSVPPPIQHVYPYDGPPIPSFPRDDTYRDLCLSSPLQQGQPLTMQNFDPRTGKVTIRNANGSINNVDTFFADGSIAGAKPGYTCMPMKGTPVNDLSGFSTDPKLSFAWHLNMGDATTAPELEKLKGVYKWDYDQTLATYGQPVSGNLYCGAQVLAHFAAGSNHGLLTAPTTNNTLLSTVDEKNIVKISFFRMAQLANCAYQYVMMRGVLPYFVYEPLGSPLQEYLWPALPVPSPFDTGVLPPAPAGDVREPMVRYCQPLINGSEARLVFTHQLKQRDTGYAWVWSTSQYPWANENEYLISEMLYEAWKDTLVTGAVFPPSWNVIIPDGTKNVGVVSGGVAQPDLRIFQSYYSNLNLPCIKTQNQVGPAPTPAPPVAPAPAPVPAVVPMAPPPPPPPPPAGGGKACGNGGGGGGGGPPHPSSPPAIPHPTPHSVHLHYPAPYSVQCLIGSIATTPCAINPTPSPAPMAPPSPEPFVISAWALEEMPPPLPYATEPLYKPRYCLSVEKYNDPTNPFAPRQRYVPVTDSAGKPIRDSRGRIIPLTDRKEYDPQTSEWFRDTSNGKLVPGFTAWTVYNAAQQALYPPLRAAIVPVDIMQWRQEIFDNCMEQRIIFDRNDWKKWMKKNGHANAQAYEDWVDAVKDAAASPGVAPIPPSPYHPPCSISYDITDSPANCMAKWSMQQCAAFAAKPLVGDNFIKLRTPYTVRDNIQKAGLKPVVESQYMAPTANGSYQADLAAVEALNETALKMPPSPYPSQYDEYYPSPIDLPYIPKDANFSYYFPINRDPRNDKFIGVDMPYLRWYDTGTQAGQEPEWWGMTAAPQARRGVSFSNTLGSFDVGGLVGRADGRTAEETGDAVALAGKANPAYPGFVTQWLGTVELPQVGAYGLFHNRLLDQAYSMRYNHFNCLPRYEVAFKQLDQMDFALARAGAQISLADTKATPVTWYKGFRGYGEYAFMKDDKGNSRYKEGFPYINNKTPTRGLLTGLDNADADDIITINYSDPNVPGSSMPRSYYVIGKYTYPNYRPSLACLYSALNCFDPSITWSTNAQALLVIGMNTGKHISSIGITDQYGISRVQTIFKSDSLMADSTVKGNWLTQALDKHVLGSYALSQFPAPYNVGITPDCTDTDYAYCTLPLTAWNTAVVWHALPRLNQPVAIPSPTPSPIPNAMVIVGNFGFNDCGTIDSQINQIPPSETSTYPNAIPITMNCFNQGMDPPMKPYSTYNWSSVGQGGFNGVGASTFTMTALCPPQCITRRLPVSAKVPNPWPLLEMEYCIQPKEIVTTPPPKWGLGTKGITGTTGIWGSGWSTCRFAYEGPKAAPSALLGISEPPPKNTGVIEQ